MQREEQHHKDMQELQQQSMALQKQQQEREAVQELQQAGRQLELAQLKQHLLLAQHTAAGSAPKQL